jgi:DNA-binding PadR family transcriptional regulator
MTSPVNWALLGLVIEREGYAFELATRFTRIYRNVITVSSTSHIYTALGILQDRAFVEQIPGAGAGRQPKPEYRATPLGIQNYGDWLVDYVREDRRRQVMFVLGLSALFGDPPAALEALERYDRAWLEQDGEADRFALNRPSEGAGVESIKKLLYGENRLTVAAKRSWVEQVRTELELFTVSPPE